MFLSSLRSFSKTNDMSVPDHGTRHNSTASTTRVRVPAATDILSTYVPFTPSPKKISAKIFGRSINTKTNNVKTIGGVRSERENDANDDKIPGSFVPGDEADVRVKWQEKIFGPEDIVTLSTAQRSGGEKQQQYRAAGPPNNPLSRLEVRRGRKLCSDVRTSRTTRQEPAGLIIYFSSLHRCFGKPHLICHI